MGDIPGGFTVETLPTPAIRVCNDFLNDLSRNPNFTMSQMFTTGCCLEKYLSIGIPGYQLSKPPFLSYITEILRKILEALLKQSVDLCFPFF